MAEIALGAHIAEKLVQWESESSFYDCMNQHSQTGCYPHAVKYPHMQLGPLECESTASEYSFNFKNSIECIKP